MNFLRLAAFEFGSDSVGLGLALAFDASNVGVLGLLQATHFPDGYIDGGDHRRREFGTNTQRSEAVDKQLSS